MSTSRQITRVLPFVYGIAIVVGFMISKPVGGAIAIVGAMIVGLSFALVGGSGRERRRRAERRAER